jgi:hypothetical protein
MQDNPMIAGFGKLRHELAGVKGTVDQLVRNLLYVSIIAADFFCF